MGWGARRNYLASDRLDIAFTTNELCKSMSAPKEEDKFALKRLCKYRKGRPAPQVPQEVVQVPQRVCTHVDSDWAGCKLTRKSTNGGDIFLGHNCARMVHQPGGDRR